MLIWKNDKARMRNWSVLAVTARKNSRKKRERERVREEEGENKGKKRGFLALLPPYMVKAWTGY